MIRQKSWFQIALLVSVLGGHVVAEPASQISLSSCRLIENNAARLACYDSLVAEESPATVANPDPTTTFGLNRKPHFNLDGDVAQKREAVLRVIELSARSDGRLLLKLQASNSSAVQHWLATESVPSSLVVRTNDEVRVKQAALGGFIMVVPSGRSVRIRRLE